MKTGLDLSRMTLKGIASRLNPLRDRIRSRLLRKIPIGSARNTRLFNLS